MKHLDSKYFHPASAPLLPAGLFFTKQCEWAVICGALSLLAFALASAANAQSDDDTFVWSSARPRFQVVDGDTVKFGAQFVRLFGIDAPEKWQTCDEGQWQPGPLAKAALEKFIGGRPVTCKQSLLI